MGSAGVERVPDGLKRRWPDIRPEDISAVQSVLERGVLGGVGAPEMTALETEWAAFVGREACLLFNSGTAAIHAALYAIGATNATVRPTACLVRRWRETARRPRRSAVQWQLRSM